MNALHGTIPFADCSAYLRMEVNRTEVFRHDLLRLDYGR